MRALVLKDYRLIVDLLGVLHSSSIALTVGASSIGVGMACGEHRMRAIARVLFLALFVTAASCSGGGGVPVVRDYTNAGPQVSPKPQSLCLKGNICGCDAVATRPGVPQPECIGNGPAPGQCLETSGCTLTSSQSVSLPSGVDGSTITSPTAACEAIGEYYSSSQELCYTKVGGMPSMGFEFTTMVYGQCNVYHDSFEYYTYSQGAYVLGCVTPGTASNPPTGWWNVEGQFIALSGVVWSLPMIPGIPNDQALTDSYTTVQSAFSNLNVKFCVANAAGQYTGLCTYSGGGISVGFQE